MPFEVEYDWKAEALGVKTVVVCRRGGVVERVDGLSEM